MCKSMFKTKFAVLQTPTKFAVSDGDSTVLSHEG